ncbi:hypothetical protein [Clavibacter sp. km1a]|uniref:hypothetical protein n=1 Tax=Clavibacter sp. km1a TaxID=3459136 RepID=UPI0040416181
MSYIPSFWAESNWARPYRFLEIAADAPGMDVSHLGPRRYMYDKIVSGFDFHGAVRRRSLAADAGTSMLRPAFESILRCLYQILAEEPALLCGVVTSDVEDWKDAAWIVDTQPRSLRQVPRALLASDFASMIQGQGWGNGPGLGVVFGIAWDRVEDAPEQLERSYARALVSVGSAGQALLLEGQHHGLAARMTPAIKESFAAEVFQLDDSVDMLYAIRLSTPKSGR